MGKRCSVALETLTPPKNAVTTTAFGWEDILPASAKGKDTISPQEKKYENPQMPMPVCSSPCSGVNS
jgi:hypothetical protein